MDQRTSGKQLLKKLLDVEKDGLRGLKKFLIPLVVLTISLNPHSATVFMMEYFKIDPSLSFQILQFALPLVVGISIARIISLLWIFPLRQFFVYLTLIIVIPILWMLRRVSSERISKITVWFDAHQQKEDLRYTQKNESGLERELFFINRSFAIIIALTLYIAQFFSNPIGQKWNPNYNKQLMIMTNVHYYCQLTGNYNEDQCKKWKAEMTEYNRKTEK